MPRFEMGNADRTGKALVWPVQPCEATFSFGTGGLKAPRTMMGHA